MSASLHLVISTLGVVLVDASDIVSVRAEDDSGSFGILPRHADLITVLTPSVVRWRDIKGAESFCAVLGGVLTVERGSSVAIACREGVLGRDLHGLEAEVRARRAAETDADRQARVEQMRLHAMAVRQMMRYLSPATHPATNPAANLDTSAMQTEIGS